MFPASLLSQYCERVACASEEIDRLPGLSQFTPIHWQLLRSMQHCEPVKSMGVCIEELNDSTERFMSIQQRIRTVKRNLLLHQQMEHKVRDRVHESRVITATKRALSGSGGETLQLSSSALRHRLEEAEVHRLTNELGSLRVEHMDSLLDSVKVARDKVANLVQSNNYKNASELACLFQTNALFSKYQRDLESILSEKLRGQKRKSEA